MPKKPCQPPLLAKKLLSYMQRYSTEYSSTGDLLEEYRELAEEKARIFATLWYWGQVFYAFPSYIYSYVYFGGMMFKNYIKVALRNLQRHKGYSFINIIGLAIGIACCLLIFLYVADESSYDRFHENADRIHRIISHSTIGGETRIFARAPSAVPVELESSIPEIEAQTRLFQFGVLRFTHEDKDFEIQDFFAADTDFFKIFSFDFISGDPETALQNPESIVVTEDTAIQIFGGADVVGNTLTVPFGDGFRELRVAGVVENIPRNSHFQFNAILSINIFRLLANDQPGGRGDFLNDPIYFNPFSFLLLAENADADAVETKIAAAVEDKWGTLYRQEGISRKYSLQSLTDIHLKSNFEAEIARQGNLQYVYIFSVVAVLVLFIACFNFINLSTARSAKRAKEVGLRKMFGSHRPQLIRQFLNESIMLSLMGMAFGVLLVILALPAFNQLSGKEFAMSDLASVPSLLVLLIIICSTGFIAGSFPAFVLSSFNPVTTIRGRLGTAKKGSVFRKVLVFIQFSISIFMVCGLLIILQQLDYIKNKDLGFDRDHLVVMRGGGQNSDAFRERVLQNPHVLSAAFPGSIPGEFTGDESFYLPGKDPADSVRASVFPIDYDFITTFDMEILEGRNFSRDFSTDAEEAVVINETFARQLGLGHDIVGRKIINVGNRDSQPTVIGIIADFHHNNLKMNINPMILTLQPQGFNFIVARITPLEVSATLTHLETIWTEQFPDREFNYYFVDDNFRQQYPEEDKMQTIYLFFGTMAIFVACLGLYGLASFAIAQRTKEIGIRKILGASVPRIALNLSKDFLKLVLLANILAWPLAFYVMNNWLDNFAYRIGLKWWVFLLAGVIALLIALLTISRQALKSALSNPVKSLRYE
jgi:putative ABC transport system permease protein